MAKIEYFANTHNNVNFLQEATTTMQNALKECFGKAANAVEDGFYKERLENADVELNEYSGGLVIVGFDGVVMELTMQGRNMSDVWCVSRTDKNCEKEPWNAHVTYDTLETLREVCMRALCFVVLDDEEFLEEHFDDFCDITAEVASLCCEAGF